MIDLGDDGEVLASTFLDEDGELPAAFIRKTEEDLGIVLTPLTSNGRRT